MDEDERMHQRLTTVLPHLNERQRRLLLAAEAQPLGHGGIARVARAAGVSRPTIYRGLTDLARPSPANRVRLGGAVTVSRGAYVGAGALVRESVTIGAWSLIGMGSLVLHDVPAGEVWAGSPARRLRQATPAGTGT